ncbi:MAG: hypothetical protein HFJ29_02600 [Clostridia bacterium]|nr:hypothetical protein [Clostridia bacterium]
MKRFISFVLTLCMVMCITPISIAMEVPNDSVAKEIDYMNYDFPEDAVILYQSEDGVVYQSKEQTSKASDGNLVSRWIEAGGSKTGVMSIKNPHTLVNTTNGYFVATSEYGQSTVKFILTDGANAIVVKEVNAYDVAVNGGVLFSFKSHVSNLAVQYFVIKSSSLYGIMVGCKLW